MKLWMLLPFLCLLGTRVFAQDTVDGIVFDKAEKERIAKVNVRNPRNGQSVYNNLKGEFKISASVGDALIFTKDGYFSDTIKLEKLATMAVYLKRNGIQLQTVNINDTLLNPEKRLAATKRDYTKLYGPSSNPDFLTVGPGGAGIGIDALYNAFSRSGRNAENLRGIIQRDYEQNVIDYRYSKALVGNITGLSGTELTEFMFKYRPSYYYTSTASEYEFIKRIRTDFRRYSRMRRRFSLPQLESSK